jgi:uncharacterized protein involved in exopolysaccharide biosynthesis
MDEQKKIVAPKSKREEIDFMILLQKLWIGRKTILIFIIIGAILGIIFAMSAPKQYTVTTTMLPQSESDGGMSKISSLAAIAGFDMDLGSNSSDISPVVYPQIIESDPFLIELMNTKFTFSKVDHPISLFDFYTRKEELGFFGTIKKYTLGLPGIILNSLKDTQPVMITHPDGLIHLTQKQELIGQSLKKNITLSINKKEGYLTLSCTFPEALLSAQVAKRSQELLQKTIIEYKTKSAAEQLQFFERQYEEKKKEYEVAQNNLANYKDRNQFLSLAMAGTEQARLQDEYNITYSVYSEMAKQLESAKIKVRKETPAFIIIKPVTVPWKKTKPNRISILLIWTLAGCIIGPGYLFSKEYIKKAKNAPK